MSVIFRKFGNIAKGSDIGTIRGVLDTAIILTAQAKALAPVDKGQLKNSIGYNAGGRDTASPALETQPKSKKQAVVGSNLEYAVYQEFGTKYQPAQPYLRPAAAIVKGQPAEKVIKDAMDKELNLSVKKGKKDTRWP
jgi:HK97 gp10 family phage protein